MMDLFNLWATKKTIPTRDTNVKNDEARFFPVGLLDTLEYVKSVKNLISAGPEANGQRFDKTLFVLYEEDLLS